MGIERKVIESEREGERRHYKELRAVKLKKGIREGNVPYDPVASKPDPNSPPRFSLILKCDVEGTMEALRLVLETYDSNHMVHLDLVKLGVGPLTDPEFELALECKATIFCFNLPVSAKYRELAVENQLKIEQFNVIYSLVSALKVALDQTLNLSKPVIERKLMGEGVVLKEFRVPDRERKKQPVAGVRVASGFFDKNHIFRIIRNTPPDFKTIVIYEGHIQSLQREKQVIKQASTGEEIALSVDNKSIRYKEDDTVEAYDEVTVQQTVNWNPPGF